MSRFAKPLLLLFTLAGCSDLWTTAPPREKAAPVSVEIFSKLPEGISGKTVQVIPIEEKQNSIEYEIYGQLVKDGFATIGWTVVEGDTVPDYVAVFDYVTDGGIDHVETRTVPQFGQTGVSSATTSGYVSSYGSYNSTTTFTPTYGITGFREIKERVTLYGHAASVSIFELSEKNLTMFFWEYHLKPPKEIQSES
jgi:hypothetical protein